MPIDDVPTAYGAAWDEVMDESFPASDPPGNATHAGPPARRPEAEAKPSGTAGATA